MSSLDSSATFICFIDARDFLKAAIKLRRLGQDLPGEVEQLTRNYKRAKQIYLSYIKTEKERRIAEIRRMQYEER